ncbi:MAG: N-acetylmuramoyl-L-alanine amidase [Bdellovibrionales bacterium]|nr:N-acetylmuramoyl-L-alanine amidase [Bdellovibrionales bacterium]
MKFSGERLYLSSFWTLVLLALLGITGCSHLRGRDIAATKMSADWTFEAASQWIRKVPNPLITPVIVPRQAWDPMYQRADLTVQKLSEIHTLVIHNSETPDFDDRGLRQVMNVHMLKNGWPDIGYHYLIALDPKDGHWKVYEGRPIDQVGAHAGVLRDSDGKPSVGLNQNTLGIVVLGTYAWRTPAKREEMLRNVPEAIRNTPEGEEMLTRLLTPYVDPKAPEYQRQPEREALHVLLELVDLLLHDPRFSGIQRIRAHGALSAIELTPTLSKDQLFGLAINPYHTDCPGHGMIHLVEAIQARYKGILDLRLTNTFAR